MNRSTKHELSSSNNHCAQRDKLSHVVPCVSCIHSTKCVAHLGNLVHRLPYIL